MLPEILVARLCYLQSHHSPFQPQPAPLPYQADNLTVAALDQLPHQPTEPQPFSFPLPLYTVCQSCRSLELNLISVSYL